MNDLNDILIFTKVVEKGSFTAAAQSLMLPKSTVSRSLSRLEARLSTRLLQRSTRRINLTEIGRRYYDRCCQIMQELEAANRIVESYRSQPSGLLRITAPYILGQAFLGEIVAEFLATYPDVQCQIELSNRRLDLIEDGFDLALRVGSLPDSSLIMTRLGQANTGLFASSSYLSKYGTPQTPAELRTQILLDLGNTLVKSRTFTSGLDRTEIAILPRLVCNDADVLLDAAIAHQGIAVLPRFVALNAIAQHRLEPVLPEWHIHQVDINALYPSYKDLSPAVNAFIDLAKRYLKTVLDDV